MAVKDTARVRTRLVGLYPKASGLRKERLDVIAAKLTATDESTDEEIDTELTAINDGGFQTFESLKVEDDRTATELAKAKKPVTEDKTEEPVEEQKSTDPVIAAMQKQMKDLSDKLAAKEASEAKAGIAERFKKDDRLKNVPPSWIRNNTPASEEDYETSVENLAKEYSDFATEHKLDTYVNDAPVAGKTPAGGKTVKQVTESEADDLASQLLGR